MWTWTGAPSRSLAKAKVPELNRALAVAIHGNPEAPVSNAQLADFLGLAPSTASRLRTEGRKGQGAGYATLLAVREKMPAVSLNDLFESAIDLDLKFGGPRR